MAEMIRTKQINLKSLKIYDIEDLQKQKYLNATEIRDDFIRTEFMKLTSSGMKKKDAIANLSSCIWIDIYDVPSVLCEKTIEGIVYSLKK